MSAALVLAVLGVGCLAADVALHARRALRRRVTVRRALAEALDTDQPVLYRLLPVPDPCRGCGDEGLIGGCPCCGRVPAVVVAGRPS